MDFVHPQYPPFPTGRAGDLHREAGGEPAGGLSVRGCWEGSTILRSFKMGVAQNSGVAQVLVFGSICQAAIRCISLKPRPNNASHNSGGSSWRLSGARIGEWGDILPGGKRNALCFPWNKFTS